MQKLLEVGRGVREVSKGHLDVPVAQLFGREIIRRLSLIGVALTLGRVLHLPNEVV